MPNTPEQTRYIEALCQIETGIQHNGMLYLPFDDLVKMVRNMPQNDISIDRDLWKEIANEWRKDAIRYRNALQDAATSFRKLSDDSYPGCEYRHGWMSYCNECWESAIETLEGKDVPD